MAEKGEGEEEECLLAIKMVSRFGRAGEKKFKLSRRARCEPFWRHGNGTATRLESG